MSQCHSQGFVVRTIQALHSVRFAERKKRGEVLSGLRNCVTVPRAEISGCVGGRNRVVESPDIG
jgi:hypothetical protein